MNRDFLLAVAQSEGRDGAIPKADIQPESAVMTVSLREPSTTSLRSTNSERESTLL
jgi:hypothetical protein